MKHTLPIFDGHCDVLCKWLLHPDASFTQDQPYGPLDVTLPRLQAGGVKAQVFAIYIPEACGPARMRHIRQSLEDFMVRIASHPDIRFIRTRVDLMDTCAGHAIGALLHLESVEGLEENLANLNELHKLGLRSVGLTWNYANWAADGVLEPRGAGFTRKGKELIREIERLGFILDVSHLHPNAFYELTALTNLPVIASHSNAHAICAHPRNLTDDQIRIIADRGGLVGITFVPWFLKESGEATLDDIVRHIEHVSRIGGTDCVVFGSDFDGIDSWVNGLRHPGQYPKLLENMNRFFNASLVEKFAYGNWIRYGMNRLP